MALVKRFEQRPIEPNRLHGEVVCGYVTRQISGRLILQLETYGSPNRENPDKVSQSLQLDEDGARALKHILEASFPGI